MVRSMVPWCQCVVENMTLEGALLKLNTSELWYKKTILTAGWVRDLENCMGNIFRKWCERKYWDAGEWCVCSEGMPMWRILWNGIFPLLVARPTFLRIVRVEKEFKCVACVLESLRILKKACNTKLHLIYRQMAHFLRRYFYMDRYSHWSVILTLHLRRA